MQLRRRSAPCRPLKPHGLPGLGDPQQRLPRLCQQSCGPKPCRVHTQLGPAAARRPSTQAMEHGNGPGALLEWQHMGAGCAGVGMSVGAVRRSCVGGEHKHGVLGGGQLAVLAVFDFRGGNGALTAGPKLCSGYQARCFWFLTSGDWCWLNC